MSPRPQPYMPDSPSNLHQRIARLSLLPEVRAAFQWFRNYEPQLAGWQLELARIPAPPFGESARAEWLKQRFLELELADVHIDEVGNVVGVRPGRGEQCVALSAHIDTVFPAGTPLQIRQQGSRLYGPGVSDNGTGVIALLAIVAALRAAEISHFLPLLFIGNVGEEGEGDLRGMRHIYADPVRKDSIRFAVVLDGAGTDTIVAEALGSRRFEVIVRGPGGHSWSDFGVPNPILVLARVLQKLTETPLPAAPKTTLNVGVIRGGTSVNSIPESASMRLDIRSTSMAEMVRLEKDLRAALDVAIEEESEVEGRTGAGRGRVSSLSSEVVRIGDRPAGGLDPKSHLLEVIRAVDAELNNAAQLQRASTDANVALSLGLECIAIGGGGSGGGAHTLQEWFDCKGRELGLKRILLALLALADGGG